jgi:hypothetical protein
MAITEYFKTAILSRDVTAIRIMMKDSMLVDPTFNEFDKMNDEAKDVYGLYEQYDKGELNYDKTFWNDDYLNKLMVQVMGNFSQERVNHLKEVVRYLRPIGSHPQSKNTTDKTSTKRTQPRKISYQEQKRKDERSGRIKSERKAKIATGIVAGGVVGGVVAAGVSASIIAGATAGAIVAGTAVYVATNGE